MNEDTSQGPQGFQVAWTEVEEGWRIIASDGTDIGQVEQGVGDRDADIFEGFEVDIGRGDDRFLSYEHIVSIVEGSVHVGLSPAAVEELPVHREVASLQVESDEASLNDRLRTDVHHAVEHISDDLVQGTDEKRRSWWRRLLGLR